MEEPNAYVSPRRIEEALNKYRCDRCGNFHVERPCGGKTEWIWALAEVLDFEMRCVDPVDDERPIPAQVVDMLAQIERMQLRVDQLREIEQRRVDAGCKASLDRAAEAVRASQR